MAEWPAETIARLRTFWDEGLSTADIGRRLGLSKNAIVGKAHRLDLPARPSPIHRSNKPSPPRPQRVHRAKATLPKLESLTPVAPKAEEPIVVAPQPPPPPAPKPVARVVQCCWPIGNPGTKGFRFCDTEAQTGKPYCPEHCGLAYVKLRDRRDDGNLSQGTNSG